MTRLGWNARKLATAVCFSLLCVVFFPAGSHATVPGENGLLAFSRPDQSKVFVMDPSRSNRPRLIATDAQDPALSPNGNKLAYWNSHSAALYLGKTEPGKGAKLLNADDGYNVDPTFSPDGRSVLYRHVESGPAQSSALRRIRLNDHSTEDLVGWPYDAVFSPSVSPNGQLIAIEGGGITLLNRSGVVIDQVEGLPDGVRKPSFSPDGSTLVFAAQSETGRAIFTSRLDGTKLVRLAPEVAEASDPVFSPDGRQIAFTGPGPGGGDLYVMTAKGLNPRVVVSSDALDRAEDWARSAPFRLLRTKKRLELKMRFFGRGTVNVSGISVRRTSKKVSSRTLRLKIKLRKNTSRKSLPVTVRFQPVGGLPSVRGARVLVSASR